MAVPMVWNALIHFPRYDQKPITGLLPIFSYKSHAFTETRPSSRRHACGLTGNRCTPNKPASALPEDAAVGVHNSELQRWSRGGGLYHKLAHIDTTAVVEAGAVVQADANLGPDVHVGSGSVVGPSVTVGCSTRIGYNVSLQNCSIGDFCIIHGGVCIGQDGFAHFVDELGNMVKKPQLLYVRIGNHVEIGANTCIDRGSWRDTVIGDHTRIDNLVQIGHNAVIGRYCILCGKVGIAGSVTLGDYVVFGGAALAADHISVVSKVRLAALSGVTKSIVEPGEYAGFPAIPRNEWQKMTVALRKIAKHGRSSSMSGTYESTGE